MAIEINITCPLGHQCEQVNNGIVERCAWYTHLEGKNPQGENAIDEWGCAIAWMPILSIEMSQTNRGQTHALESFRNETIKLASQRRIERD